MALFPTSGHTDDAQSALPALVQTLRKKIQGKTPEETKKIIDDILGQPSRDVGSGVHIPCWDFPNGKVLGYSTFVFNSGLVVWLRKSSARIETSLYGSYEMSSNANRHWLGDITLNANGQYEFKKADVHQVGWFDGQESNYFLTHPHGTFKAESPKGLRGDILLDSLADGAEVAKLTFSSTEGAVGTFTIMTDSQQRRLSFSGVNPIKFEMTKPW